MTPLPDARWNRFPSERGCTAQAEVHPEVALRYMELAAADFVHLLSLARGLRFSRTLQKNRHLPPPMHVKARVRAI